MPNIPNISDPVALYKEAMKYLEDSRDLQKEIAELKIEEKNTLFEQFNIQKDLASSLIQNLRRRGELTDSIARDTEKANNYAKVLATTQHETRRAEIKQNIDSINQRIAGYQVELGLLKKIWSSGWLPIVALAANTWELFKKMDAAAWEFRKTMGMSREHCSKCGNRFDAHWSKCRDCI
jgi:hypothetical protein